MLTHVLITDAHRRLVSILQAYWRCWRRKLCQQNDSERAGGRLKQRHGGNKESCVLDCRRNCGRSVCEADSCVDSKKKQKYSNGSFFFWLLRPSLKQSFSFFRNSNSIFLEQRHICSGIRAHTGMSFATLHPHTNCIFNLPQDTKATPTLTFSPSSPVLCWYFFFG